jgi:ATP synthase protein I
MLASYAVVLRRSAVITTPAALVMIVLGAIFGGGKGLAGALLGAALVAVFFGISALVVSWVGKRRPKAVTAAAVAAYIVKVLAMLVIVARFSGTTAFNGKIFGLTAVGCILVWTGAQAVTTLRLKVLYVEPNVAKEADGTTVRGGHEGADEPGTPGSQPSVSRVPSAPPGGER